MKILLLLLILFYPIADALQTFLTYNPASFVGTLCQPIVMTCQTIGLTSHRWFFNDIEHTTYTFHPRPPPFTLYNESGINVVLTVADPIGPVDASDTFNGTSELTTTIGALIMANISTIQCGTNAHRSENINLSQIITVITIPSPIIVCSVSLSSQIPETLKTTFEWSPSFSSQHSIDSYHVLVSPDPSNCSSDRVIPSADHSCSGLAPEIVYNFIVSAMIDCRSQEGERASFTIQLPQAPQMTDEVTVQPTYDQNNELSDIFVQWREVIPENCNFYQLNYTVVLVDSAGVTAEERKVSSDSCRDGLCNTTLLFFNSERNESYHVGITINGIRESNRTFSSVISATGPTHGDVRLVGGSHRDGAVEIYSNGEWRLVCFHSWDIAEADVVCRQLGFPGAFAVGFHLFNSSSSTFLLADVDCIGNETKLVDCPADPVGNNDCLPDQFATARCIGMNCSHGEIRLVGGNSDNQGHVEVCGQGVWGNVCGDSSWDTIDASVVCRQLEFPDTGAIAFSHDHFEAGPILLDEVSCAGNESRLVDCGANSLGIHNCDHSEDAGVMCLLGTDCTHGEIRLVGGDSEYQGRVEVCGQGVWGTVCSDNWDNIDANVVCRQLVFPDTGAIAVSQAHFGEGEGPILLDEVSCTGNEARLITCAAPPLAAHNCTHGQDAGVMCQQAIIGGVGSNYSVNSSAERGERDSTGAIVGATLSVFVLMILVASIGVGYIVYKKLKTKP